MEEGKRGTIHRAAVIVPPAAPQNKMLQILSKRKVIIRTYVTSVSHLRGERERREREKREREERERREREREREMLTTHIIPESLWCSPLHRELRPFLFGDDFSRQPKV